MKILLQRQQSVFDGCLVELNANNIVGPRSSGSALGIASNCRTVEVEDSSSEISTHYICDVTISGDCIAKLSGGAAAEGCNLYATSTGLLTASVSGDVVAMLAPRAYPSLNDYVDSELVSVVIR